MVVVIVSGFASLGLEIVWFRLMLQFVTATTEAFTAMLATVLGGIAIGGLVAAVDPATPPRSRAALLGIVQAADRRRRGGQHDRSAVDGGAGLGHDGALAGGR